MMNQFSIHVEGEVIIDTNLSREDFINNYLIFGGPFEWFMLVNKAGERISIQGRDIKSIVKMPCTPSPES